MTFATLRPAVIPIAVSQVALEISAAVATARSDEPIGVVFFTLLPLPLLVVGTILARRRPDNAVGWGFLGMGALLSISALQEGLLNLHHDGETVPGLPAIVLVVHVLGAFAILLTLVPSLFPDGRLPGRFWRGLWWAALTTSLIGAIGALSTPQLGLTDVGILVSNPVHPPAWVDRIDVVARAVEPIIGVIALLSVPVALVVRWRRADARERTQIKVFVYFVAVYTAAGVVGFATLRGTPREVFSDAFFMSLYVAFPTVVGIAILRHGLYGIDRIISRTVTYTLITALLVVPYALVVPVITRTVNSDLAVATATLAAAGAFNPLRRRVQARVDRRFNRARYDAASTIDDFAARLRSEVDLDEVTRDLLTVVRRTVQPSYASLWLRATP
ncbi:MAG: hypothetical protein ABR520_07240 [Mycobacteriales bacterium]|nr:hypothetical protein [Frankia sp.]